MEHNIKRYPVRHPLLRNYIKFFWELQSDNMILDHRLIPQRNINMRFNLSETPQYILVNGKEQKMESVFFSGLQDQFMNAHLQMSGKVHIIGICFLPEGFFPFLKIPVSEFKNQWLGTGEAGFVQADEILERMREARDINVRLGILESELVEQTGLAHVPESFRKLFNALRQSETSGQLAEFCSRNGVGLRTLERMYNKYVGVSAMTFCTLNRFQNSLNQLLFSDYSKLSDLAYGNGYFDQMHFIREFKRFAGNSPKGFVHQKNSILQIGKLS